MALLHFSFAFACGLSIWEDLCKELLYVMYLDDTERNKTYCLFSKSLKIRNVYSYKVKQYVTWV